jgi:hypothetical protein
MAAYFHEDFDNPLLGIFYRLKGASGSGEEKISRSEPIVTVATFGDQIGYRFTISTTGGNQEALPWNLEFDTARWQRWFDLRSIANHRLADLLHVS